MPLFSYSWTLKSIVFKKNKGKVFSCFSCGGGSSLGYKLAGFDVIGCNEIDPRMMQVYKENHNPKYAFLESIQTFKQKKEFPKELYNLDILDGSPPCSSFSLMGNREKDWGVLKKFKEGQAVQVLDTLFFDFIDLAKILQPKIVVAENVVGILTSSNFRNNYGARILKAFTNAGYIPSYYILDSSKMGVPQKRERIFFIAIRKDISSAFIQNSGFFNKKLNINMIFNEPVIKSKKILTNADNRTEITQESTLKILKSAGKNGICRNSKNTHNTGYAYKIFPNNICPTISCTSKYSDESGMFEISKKELCNFQTFPEDYNFLECKPQYIIGMSVPPVMIAQIATRIYSEILSKIK
jgi:DNA (cytosine-5)-methyltransferase 1